MIHTPPNGSDLLPMMGRWAAGVLFCLGAGMPTHAQDLPRIVTSGAFQSSARALPLAGVAGCPDRGGLLDSISVPVGQPLNLSVLLGAPAPKGGATFQLSSNDPSIVAAGDKRQAFLPRVFVPEGQTVSNEFTIFGIKIGGTRLRLIALTPGFGSASFPLGAWDVNRGGDERFIDANSALKTCRASDASNDISTDPNRLSQCGAPVKGIASDALSQLLLRSVSGLPGTMCYEITSSSAFDQGRIQTPLLTTQRVGTLDYGFSFYKAPEFFGDTSDFRTLEVEFTFTPSIGNGNTTRFRARTKIVRPPVVLVHGVWSKAGAWSGDYTKKDNANAIASLEKAVKLDDKDPVAQSGLGVAYRQAGELDKAERAFVRAIEMKPQAEFYFNLATVYRRQGKVKEAIEKYNKAIELDQSFAEAFYDLGMMLAQEKRSDEAVAAWNRYLELIAAKNPKEAEIVRKHITDLGGKPKR